MNTVREVRELVAEVDVYFAKVGRSANGVVDYFSKLGVSNHFLGVFFEIFDVF